MPDARPLLTLAHSADPDDVFMWWPVTGKMLPSGAMVRGKNAEPRIDTGRFRFRAVPGDISVFNRRAAAEAPYDITALSVRAYADVMDRYVLTRCGSSFGEGYGPKVVVKAEGSSLRTADDLRRGEITIAVPGLKTSAFLTLGLMLSPAGLANAARFVEMPFDAIMPAVACGKVDAGLVIHEGQMTFAESGLREVVDLGRWWGETRGLPLPLGVNAIKRDLDARFGGGAVSEVAATLGRSLAFALEHYDEAIDTTMPFARLNAERSGTPPPGRETVVRYVRMYVTALTNDMGDIGMAAIRRLLEEGAAAGLCPQPGAIEAL